MKSAEEIQNLLVSELLKHLDAIKSIRTNSGYFNEVLGDTSFLLAGLLGILLEDFNEWDKSKWIDDSLISKVEIQAKNKVILCGIVIFGRKNTTEQWTEPFCFDIELNLVKKTVKRFTFLFSDLSRPEITYEEFSKNRNYWDNNIRDWRYVINGEGVME